MLNEAAKRDADPLAKVIAARQWVDWRELRCESITSSQVRKMFAKMATQIAEALERGHPKHEAAAAPSESRRDTDAISATLANASVQPVEASRGPVQKTEPPTHVVDTFHRGDHSTLTDALQAAKPGDRIVVRPGLYKEGILIDRPVEMIGDGNPDEVVIEAAGKEAVLFKASMGRIANLTLRQAAQCVVALRPEKNAGRTGGWLVVESRTQP